MTPLLPLALALAQAPPPDVVVMPLVQQGGALVLSDQVTAGGLGGALGVQAIIGARWLVQLDVGPLWLLGEPWLARLAAGVQHPVDDWTPAAWLSLSTLWGDRVEQLGADARRPPIPSWGLGLRLSPLRFTGALGAVSALELGAATDFAGTLWIDVALLQAAARW